MMLSQQKIMKDRQLMNLYAEQSYGSINNAILDVIAIHAPIFLIEMGYAICEAKCTDDDDLIELYPCATIKTIQEAFE